MDCSPHLRTSNPYSLQEKFLFHYSPWKSGFALNEPALNILYLKKKRYIIWIQRKKWLLLIGEPSGEGLSKDSTFGLRLEEKFPQLVCGRNSWVRGNSTATIQENEKDNWEIPQIPSTLTLIFLAWISWSARIGTEMINLIWSLIWTYAVLESQLFIQRC